MGFRSSSPRKRPTARNTQQRERGRRSQGLRHLPRLPLLCKPTLHAVQLRFYGLQIEDRFVRPAASFFGILFRLSIDTFVSSSRVSSLAGFMLSRCCRQDFIRFVLALYYWQSLVVGGTFIDLLCSAIQEAQLGVGVWEPAAAAAARCCCMSLFCLLDVPGVFCWSNILVE
ncbi:unnamed protein product [Sphagnum compactum]